jgi:hypothetical protein
LSCCRQTPEDNKPRHFLWITAISLSRSIALYPSLYIVCRCCFMLRILYIFSVFIWITFVFIYDHSHIY